MKKIIFALVCFSTVIPSLAEGELMDLCVKPGSLRGHIAVLNTQTMIPESVFVEASEILRDRRRYAFKFGCDDSVFMNATVQLRIVDNPQEPAPMTVSPEIGRGVLNVAALTNGIVNTKSDSNLLINRAKLEFLRLICYAFGVGGSQFSGNLLSATSLRELDNMQAFIPVDVFDKIDKSAKRRGMSPEVIAEYYEACQQGWAPFPTNARQKAIWDKVHTIPTNPMKIKYQPKK